ncbi:MAG TPA: hypothetical protein VMG10_35310 [Gemmataceae bacterium]|nr:hypothetical protein [Gemmataceae bacterium]
MARLPRFRHPRAKALAELPAEEWQACEKIWADVMALLKGIEQTK